MDSKEFLEDNCVLQIQLYSTCSQEFKNNGKQNFSFFYRTLCADSSVVLFVLVSVSWWLRLLANNIDLRKSLNLPLCRILKLTTALKEQVKVHVAWMIKIYVFTWQAHRVSSPGYLKLHDCVAKNDNMWPFPWLVCSASFSTQSYLSTCRMAKKISCT